MIYLDTNILVYAAIHKGKEGNTSRMLLRTFLEKDQTACTAALTWDELVHSIWKKEGKTLALEEGDKFFELPNLTILRVDAEIIAKAQDLLKIYNLKPRDAIHAATAIINNCTEIVSDDPDFDKIKELKRRKI